MAEDDASFIPNFILVWPQNHHVDVDPLSSALHWSAMNSTSCESTSLCVGPSFSNLDPAASLGCRLSCWMDEAISRQPVVTGKTNSGSQVRNRSFRFSRSIIECKGLMSHLNPISPPSSFSLPYHNHLFVSVAISGCELRDIVYPPKKLEWNGNWKQENTHFKAYLWLTFKEQMSVCPFPTIVKM